MAPLARLIPLLVVAALLSPGAQACHIGVGVGGATGVVTGPDGAPATARLSFFNCEGTGTVVVHRDTPDGGTVSDAFEATLDIVTTGPAVDLIDLGDGCIFGTCGFGSPAVAFTLRAAGGYFNATGLVVNGVHYVIALAVVGTYAGGPAAFAAAAS